MNWTILVLEYKNKKHCKVFHLSTKLIAKSSDIDEAFKSLHWSIIIKIKDSASKDWIVFDVIIKQSIKIFEFA